MSGFAAVFHLDGAPVDRGWLESMAQFLAVRGPDGSQVWVSGNAGLCHTLLRTLAETDGRPQIASLDGCTWIAGDVRIDDRQTLIAKLPSDSRKLKSASSAELILHAYSKWGTACVEHLLGDFSFVIWDGRVRRVLCARDHLGVKPLYYASIGQSLIVSNTLDAIRRIPLVSDELNEQAIGDFLIIGENKDPTTTFFTDIRRLRVAHRLIAEVEGLRTERYWTLPIDEPLYYKRSGDYVDRFHDLLRAAVKDRLPDGPLGILMSGGLDSPAVAASAVQLGADTTAFTSVYDRLIPDQERYYAGLVADYLGIPIRFNIRDEEPWGWEPGSTPIHTPQPVNAPTGLYAWQQYGAEVSGHSPVFFIGDGPDASLRYEWRLHLTYLIRKRRWGRLFQDIAFHLVAHRRVPLLPTLPRIWRERSKNPDLYQFSLPSWINREFEERLNLSRRFEEIIAEPSSSHQTRKIGYGCYACEFPMGGGEGWDAGATGVPVDFRHPFWDLRLVRFLLVVPALPWCRDKYLLRAALRGFIPEAVRKRPKSPLAGLPYMIQARSAQQPELLPVGAFARYVDVAKLPKWPGRNREELDHALRGMGLHYWMLGL